LKEILPILKGVSSTMKDFYVREFAINETSVFAGTSGGGVFLSTDNGTSWVQVNNGLTNTWVFALAVSETAVFVGTYDGVFVSTNNGTSWTAANSGLTNYFINSIVISGEYIFTGTAGGVFLSTDNGTSWTEMNDGLTNITINALAISETTVFAGTNGSAVWKRPLSEFVGINDVSSTNRVMNIYPNPASDMITVIIDPSINPSLTLKIYNITGSLVKTELVKENQQQINVSDLNSGIYMVEIKSKNVTSKKKLIIN
jgi:ligand-binding sensor domain-containing protein